MAFRTSARNLLICLQKADLRIYVVSNPGLRHPNGRVRYFTVREAARLQTFPDGYEFHGSWTETMRQLGNAVPVQLSFSVAESVAMALQRDESAIHSPSPRSPHA